MTYSFHNRRSVVYLEGWVDLQWVEDGDVAEDDEEGDADEGGDHEAVLGAVHVNLCRHAEQRDAGYVTKQAYQLLQTEFTK